MAYELRDRNAPESQFDPKVVGKEHSHRVAIEESIAKRKWDIPIVVKRGREYEDPSCATFRNPKEFRTPPGHCNAKDNGSEAHDGGNIQFAGLARASLPMIVSKARLSARRVTTSRVSERSASLERIPIFRIR